MHNRCDTLFPPSRDRLRNAVCHDYVRQQGY
jgi:hypothetical protein